MTDSITRVTPSDAPMRLFDAIYTLRATRIYHDRPIPGPVLDQILQAATMSCSSGNTQPWEFVVVTDPKIKQEIKAHMTDAFSKIDAERAQTEKQLTDSSGRSVTGSSGGREHRSCPGDRGRVLESRARHSDEERVRAPIPTARCARRARSRAGAA